MDGIQDEFQGFGEAFNGFPKRLPDDCAEYTLLIIDSKLKSQKELLSRLELVRKESLKLTDELLKEYIWQRDPFALELKSDKGNVSANLPRDTRLISVPLGLMYLHGLSNYGDSVEDEWLIVYLLKELSKRFPDLWIKVVDSDGEFLLIEAANALPRWLNPEIADNRVWIHNDKLRIIPLSAVTSSTSSKTSPISRSLTIEESLKSITSTPEILINSPLVEEEAFYRLRNYPAQISASLHYSTVTIPRKLAYILHSHPTAIAPAVEAFYLRDTVALKPLQTASSQLIFPPEDLVTISVKFTKVLYAQLKSQQFSVPFAWKSIITQPDDDEESEKPKDLKYVQLEMGMKITSGFEMLVSDDKNSDNRQVRAIKIVLEDLTEDEDINLPTDKEISEWTGVNRIDDEKWLDINFEDFERELQGGKETKKSSKAPGTFGPEPPSGFGDAKTQSDLKKMVERFEAFLNDDDAGVDGAELDDMDYDDDDDDDDLDDDSEDEDKDVSFDENEFARMMREMMGMPTEVDTQARAAKPKQAGRIEELDSDDEDSENEAEELKKVMQRMEAELNEEGALNLDPTPKKLAALKNHAQSDANTSAAKEDWEDESDEDINIDFNLAKNLLESFKSQAGMAGPGGNLLGMMGMQLPRDEEDRTNSDK